MVKESVGIEWGVGGEKLEKLSRWRLFGHLAEV